MTYCGEIEYPLKCKHGVDTSDGAWCGKCRAELAESEIEQRKERWPFLCRDVYCGWHCPPGWYPAVEKLCDLLERIGGVQLAQVKEKFGGLRFYVDGGPYLAHELIKACEAASIMMCQDCGAPGVLRKNGTYWVATLCDKCGEGWKVCK